MPLIFFVSKEFYSVLTIFLHHEIRFFESYQISTKYVSVQKTCFTDKDDIVAALIFKLKPILMEVF